MISLTASPSRRDIKSVQPPTTTSKQLQTSLAGDAEVSGDANGSKMDQEADK